MIVVPAIDLKNGKCVRLLHGKANQETIYSDDPVSMAKEWEAQGAKRLHVIDLDGAFEGESQNLSWVLRIKEETNMFIQMGGGLRTTRAVKAILNQGIDKVILGTVVFTDPQQTAEIFKDHSKQIIVAFDVKGDDVSIKGWKENSGIKLNEGLKKIEDLGCEEIIFTDISRDGTLEGSNVQATQDVMSKTKMKVFASGGVSTIKDIQELVKIDSYGCIVGKALYEKRLDLAEAIKLGENGAV